MSGRRTTAIAIDVQRASPLWRALPGAAALARRAAKAAVAGADVALLPGAELAVSLADDDRVRAANGRWRGKDKATNVLSFPGAPPARIGASLHIGDVILAYETVAAEAEAEGKRLADHLAHLVAHGVLHCLGYDHETKGDAERMEDLERAILARLGVADPYGPEEGRLDGR